ncbi:hypothetical protein E4634_13550 [Mangrovimicrobium sediminis]|uniref:Uncharacterized protein n=1 Tax=Mangrovimicrobium sediminis TaxID=2562682 RepID=A0A4Z0LZK3_9GAMM|nr:hypothetical protein [Haliea sp. SAOS-164]TGD72548.1 hypothetical protein E4634_13550 [Haliea sp. SAOS-164]
MRSWLDLLLLPVALGLAFVLVFSLHLLWKPADLALDSYDPTVLYALAESVEDFGRNTCGPRQVTAFGGSILFRAIAARYPAAKWERWQFYDGDIGDYRVHLVTRQGSRPGFDSLDPLLAALPQCPKILLFQSNVIKMKQGRNKQARLQDQLDDYFYSAVFHLRYILEGAWPAPLRSSFHGTKYPNGNPAAYDAGPLRKAKPPRPVKRKDIHAALPLFRQLIAGGATVVVVDLARGPEIEAMGGAKYEAYRSELRQLAVANQGLEFLEFPTLDNTMYKDKRHLNGPGSDIFRAWLDEQLAALGL